MDEFMFWWRWLHNKGAAIEKAWPKPPPPCLCLHPRMQRAEIWQLTFYKLETRKYCQDQVWGFSAEIFLFLWKFSFQINNFLFGSVNLKWLDVNSSTKWKLWVLIVKIWFFIDCKKRFMLCFLKTRGHELIWLCKNNDLYHNFNEVLFT